MKKLVLLISLLTSFSAFAFIDVECISFENPKLLFQIEEPFPRNAAFTRARLDLEDSSFFYNVTRRRINTFNRINYSGAGVNLEVDLWPDIRPTWGRSYRSELSYSNGAGNWTRAQVECRFFRAL